MSRRGEGFDELERKRQTSPQYRLGTRKASIMGGAMKFILIAVHACAQLRAQFVVTRRTEVDINYGQGVERMKMTKTTLETDIGHLVGFTDLGKSRIGQLTDQVKKYCTDSGCDAKAEVAGEPPNSISRYNGYEVKLETSTLSEAFIDCPSDHLPMPTKGAEEKELAKLMKKHDVVKQPVLVENDMNYVWYRTQRHLSSDRAIPSSKPKKYYFLVRLPGDKELGVNDSIEPTTAVKFICLYKRGSIKVNKDEYNSVLIKIQTLWQDIKRLLNDIHSKLQICEPSEKAEGGTTTTIMDMDISSNITSIYYKTERMAHRDIPLGEWEEVLSQLESVKRMGEEMLQSAKNCFLKDCNVAIGDDDIELNCDRSKSIKGKGIFFTPYPYTRGGETFMMQIDHVITDFAHQYCTTQVHGITWNLDHRCCENIAANVDPRNFYDPEFCPRTKMINGPLVINYGKYKQLTTEDARVVAKCGTKETVYTPIDDTMPTYYGNCKVTVEGENMATQVAGLGKKLSVTGLELEGLAWEYLGITHADAKFYAYVTLPTVAAIATLSYIFRDKLSLHRMMGVCGFVRGCLANRPRGNVKRGVERIVGAGQAKPSSRGEASAPRDSTIKQYTPRSLTQPPAYPQDRRQPDVGMEETVPLNRGAKREAPRKNNGGEASGDGLLHLPREMKGSDAWVKDVLRESMVDGAKSAAMALKEN